MDDKRIDELINKALQEDLALPEGLSERLERRIDFLAQEEVSPRVSRRRSFYWISGIAAAILGALFLIFTEINRPAPVMADTFTDPEEAAVVAQNALAFMSRNLNKGLAREITFSDLTLEEARQLHTFDEYFKGEIAFERAGKKITPKLLLEAIRTLPEEKRKAVLLYYFEGMNDTEIAELFDTSRSTIQYRRTSSFELLKKYLEENADEWDEW